MNEDNEVCSPGNIQQGAEKWMRASCLAVGRRRSLRRTAAERVQGPGLGPRRLLKTLGCLSQRDLAAESLAAPPRWLWHRLRRGSLHPTPRRSQRRPTPFFSNLLAFSKQGEDSPVRSRDRQGPFQREHVGQGCSQPMRVGRPRQKPPILCKETRSAERARQVSNRADGCQIKHGQEKLFDALLEDIRVADGNRAGDMAEKGRSLPSRLQKRH